MLGIPVATFPEWTRLRRFQDIRDCIVHHYGYLDREDKRHECIRELTAKSEDIRITSEGRIDLTRALCELHLDDVAAFFKRLFEAADSKPGRG